MTNKHDHFNELFINCLHTTCFWRAAPKNSQSGQNFEMLVLVNKGKQRGKAEIFVLVHFSRLPYELGQRRFEVTDQRGLKKKNALYLSVNVFSRKVLIGDTIFTSRRLPFYVVIGATRRSSHLQSKGSTFISLLF